MPLRDFCGDKRPRERDRSLGVSTCGFSAPALPGNGLSEDWKISGAAGRMADEKVGQALVAEAARVRASLGEAGWQSYTVEF